MQRLEMSPVVEPLQHAELVFQMDDGKYHRLFMCQHLLRELVSILS